MEIDASAIVISILGAIIGLMVVAWMRWPNHRKSIIAGAVTLLGGVAAVMMRRLLPPTHTPAEGEHQDEEQTHDAPVLEYEGPQDYTDGMPDGEPTYDDERAASGANDLYEASPIFQD